MAEDPLAVVLSVAAGTQTVGAPLRVSVEVRNISDGALWMVGVADGSETGFRYPRYLPRVTGPSQPPGEEEMPDMAAPLRVEDFRRLNPGEGFDPTVPADGASFLPLTAFNGFRPQAPGRYEFRLTLDTESERDEQWLGIIEYPGKEAVLARLAGVPRLRVESNTVSVEVR